MMRVMEYGAVATVRANFHNQALCQSAILTILIVGRSILTLTDGLYPRVRNEILSRTAFAFVAIPYVTCRFRAVG